MRCCPMRNRFRLLSIQVRSSAMKKAIDCDGELSKFHSHYKYQEQLTKHLDDLDSQPFTQALVNEIVLWKVNRYARLKPTTLELLDKVIDVEPGSHRSAHKAILALLDEHGVDLPMASTLLRFRNPDTFQIIDRHAYRALYGEVYPLSIGSTHEVKIDLYFRYLDELVKFARTKNVEFRTLDRALYVFDKQINGKL